MTEPGGSATSSEIVFYQGEDGRSRIQVRLESGTVWLTQRLLAELFQKDVRTVNEHLQNIFEEGEADPGATIRKVRIVQTEGNRQVALLGRDALRQLVGVARDALEPAPSHGRAW
jgi:hypothetical protein